MKIKYNFLIWYLAFFISFNNLNSQYKNHSSEDIDPRLYCQEYDIKSQSAVDCYKMVADDYPKSAKAHYFLSVAYIYNNDKTSTKSEFLVLCDLDSRYAIMLLDVISHVKPEWIEDFKPLTKNIKTPQ